MVKNLPANVGGFPDSSVGKESRCDAGDPGSTPGSGRSTKEGIGYQLQYSWASLVAQLVKKKVLPQCSRPGFNPWVRKIPRRRGRLPIPVFWPEEFHGLYSPWGHKESDTTEQLSLPLNVRIKFKKKALPKEEKCCPLHMCLQRNSSSSTMKNQDNIVFQKGNNSPPEKKKRKKT